jgi:hypothetical protein
MAEMRSGYRLRGEAGNFWVCMRVSVVVVENSPPVALSRHCPVVCRISGLTHQVGQGGRIVDESVVTPLVRRDCACMQK